MADSFDYKFQLNICGSEQAGKKSFAVRILYDIFSDSCFSSLAPTPTIVEVENVKFRVTLLVNSATPDRFRDPYAPYVLLSHKMAVAIICDVMNRKSFEYAQKVLDEFAEYGNKKCLKFIICSKSDNIDPSAQAVSFAEIDEVASTHTATVFRVSSKTGDNVKECLEQIARKSAEISGVSLAPPKQHEPDNANLIHGF